MTPCPLLLLVFHSSHGVGVGGDALKWLPLKQLAYMNSVFPAQAHTAPAPFSTTFPVTVQLSRVTPHCGFPGVAGRQPAVSLYTAPAVWRGGEEAIGQVRGEQPHGCYGIHKGCADTASTSLSVESWLDNTKRLSRCKPLWPCGRGTPIKAEEQPAAFQ